MAFSGGVKRAYQPEETSPLQSYQSDPTPSSPPARASSSAAATTTSAFRNVSACNRCRVRKNRCDQRLPACAACEKANARCTGWDPITKREIPRSYIYYLETRQQYLESLLTANGIPFDPPDAFDPGAKREGEGTGSPKQEDAAAESRGISSTIDRSPDSTPDKRREDDEKIDKMMSNISMVSVEGASDARYLGSTSGISFARLVMEAVKSSLSTNSSEKSGVRPSRPSVPGSVSASRSMRDSYFGLQTRPTMKKAPFPDRQLAEKLVNLYFEYANPQIPILHRGEYMEMFTRVYDSGQSAPRDLYLLNIVFAIGAGTIFGSSDPDPDADLPSNYAQKRVKLAGIQHQPEEYHASAIVHLGSMLGSSSSGDKPDGMSGSLEELQAVLLLASFALLRPVAPGLWYITGVAVRLAIDLGLHFEDGSTLQVRESNALRASNPDVEMTDPDAQAKTSKTLNVERGRREWIRDMRRRLWWCVYNFDRLVSTCVGRPFGITDVVVTTEFPSPLDDEYITKEGFRAPLAPNAPSYKLVSYHYFRLRLLQSEMVQVLQYQQAQIARQNGVNLRNEFMHTKLPSPFLLKFGGDFRRWRKDIDRRFWEWKESAPKQHETGVNFKVEFLELNYWQAVTTLYRQSLSTPQQFANEMSPTADVASPTSPRIEDPEDEDDVFLKCAEAGHKTLKIYRQLHRMRLVNYTYLATHHLFMAGISFLYAIWHSRLVRSRLTLDEVDFTILAATSVLGDLMEKCPPAEACRDVFQRMARATVQMFANDFGSERIPAEKNSTASQAKNPRPSTTSGSGPHDVPSRQDIPPQQRPIAPKQNRSRRPPPRFDPDLRELFADDLDPSNLPSQSIHRPFTNFESNPPDQGRIAVPTSTFPTSSFTSFQSQNLPTTGVKATSTGPMGVGAAGSPVSSVTEMSTSYNSNQTAPSHQHQQPPQLAQPPHRQAIMFSSPETNFAQPSFAQPPGSMDYFSVTGTTGETFTSDAISDIDPGFSVAGFDFTHDWGTDIQGTGGDLGPIFGVDLLDGYWFGGGGNGGVGFNINGGFGGDGDGTSS